jgi:Protein of unknown function (DUF664)
MDSEARALVDCLDDQRDHVFGILEGMPDDALHRPVLPSGWTCLGLVNHLALDVERFWFQQVVAGEGPGFGDGDDASAWEVSPDVEPGQIFERYRREIGHADVVIAATSLDAPPRAWPPFFGDWSFPDFRSTMLHVIAETACHAGHLDAVRELFDGRTWSRLK